MLVSFFFLSGEFPLHIPCWFSFLCKEFLLHIPCWLYFSVGSFSYTSHAGYVFLIWGVSLTHPVQIFFLSSSSSSPPPPPPPPPPPFFVCFFCFCFVFNQESFSYTFLVGFIFLWGVSLTHPVLAYFLSREFLLHIPCWLYFIFCFSYTSRAGFFF